MRSPMQSTVFSGIACARLSKSNMRKTDPHVRFSLESHARGCQNRTCGSVFLLRPSAETIGSVEEVPDVARDRVFQHREAAVIAGRAQPIDLALREVLVARANLLGHVDILDIRPRAERG